MPSPPVPFYGSPFVFASTEPSRLLGIGRFLFGDDGEWLVSEHDDCQPLKMPCVHIHVFEGSHGTLCPQGSHCLQGCEMLRQNLR